MQKYKLVCFDVDGTLVDNIEYSWELFHNFFKVDMKKRETARDKYFNKKIKSFNRGYIKRYIKLSSIELRQQEGIKHRIYRSN